MQITPKSSWGWVKALLHSVYDQPDAAAVHAQFDRIVDALTDKLPAVATRLEDARPDILAFTAYPKDLWRQIWSKNPNCEPRDPASHRRGRHLPRPDRDHPPRRRPSWPSSTTNGKAAATSGSTSSPEPKPSAPRPRR